MLSFQRSVDSETLQNTQKNLCTPIGADIPLDFGGKDSRRGDARCGISRGYRTITTRPIREAPVRFTCVMLHRGEEGGATEHKHPIYYTPKRSVCQLLICSCRKVCRIYARSLPRDPPITTETTRDPRCRPPKGVRPETIALYDILLCGNGGNEDCPSFRSATHPCCSPTGGWPPIPCSIRPDRPDPLRGVPQNKPPQTGGCHGS